MGSRILAKKSHSEHYWELLAPATLIRCIAHYKSTGGRCRSEASSGSTVCDKHGALAPHVQAAAARRLQMSADDLARSLIEWANDPNVDMRERVKIAHDVLDRVGLAATNKVLVGVVTDDPLTRLFADLATVPGILSDPNAVQVKALPARDEVQEAIDRAEGTFTYDDLISGRAEIVDAEIVEDRPPAHTIHLGVVNPKTPDYIREALKSLL